jgi:hypothetical protein
MYCVENIHLTLIIHIALIKRIRNSERRSKESTHKKHVNGDLFSLVLKIIDVCSRHTLCRIRQNTFKVYQKCHNVWMSYI